MIAIAFVNSNNSGIGSYFNLSVLAFSYHLR